MLDKLGGYRTALYLSIVVALANCALWGIVLPYRAKDSTGAVIWCAISLLIPLGIWLQNGFIRYAGAAFLILAGGSLIWPLVSSGAAAVTRPALFAAFVIIGALNLLTAGVLLFSKKFGAEFAEEGKRQPGYKRYVKWSVAVAVIGGMVIATANDIIRLASN